MINTIGISEKEFLQLKDIIYTKSGLHITKENSTHLKNKLYDRLVEKDIQTFRDYYDYLIENEDEIQSMINAVTTNETYFFREQKHFDFLKKYILPNVKYEQFRCWSAAGSNGSEVYSIAMELKSNLSTYQNWELTMSDINDDMVKFAKDGIYPLKYTQKIPEQYLKEYCFKGQNEDEGFFKINKTLKKNILYKHINLMDPRDSELGMFDVVFLRNVIIYFNDEDKKRIVENVIKHLKKDGYLFMGHSESLYRITDKVIQIQPSIYKKS